MKGLLILLLSLPLALVAQEPQAGEDSFPVQTKVVPGNAYEYEQFILKLDEFNRKLGGCPKRGSTETCYAPNGVYDAKLWKDLTKRAERVFHLPRPKNK